MGDGRGAEPELYRLAIPTRLTEVGELFCKADAFKKRVRLAGALLGGDPPAAALNPAEFKLWRDTIFTTGQCDSYLEYLNAMGILTR
jgi:hypothetical protein